jgi:hypothetical protein
MGHLMQSPTIKGLGVCSVASPLPIVFTTHKGIETFAMDFQLKYLEHGREHIIQITPQLYGTFSAPYAYRNVIGAAISYGPLLPPEITNHILGHSLRRNGPLWNHLNLPTHAENLHLQLSSRTRNDHRHWALQWKE